MYTINTNASVSTPIVEVKEAAVAPSKAKNEATDLNGPVTAPSPAADTISEVETEPQAKVSNENGTSSYNQNLESGILNETSKANDLLPPFDQASAPVRVVSATPEVMPMETNVVLSTNNVEIAGVGVQEAAVGDKNESRMTEIGLLGGRGQQDAPLNPLELFASVATSPNVDATIAQFREDKARRQAEVGHNEVVSSRVEELT